jgi:hypothetical protein
MFHWMFEWIFFWRRRHSPKPEAEPKIEVAPKTEPEVDMPLEQRAGVLMLPVRSSVASPAPAAARTKLSVSKNRRVDYFTHGCYAAHGLDTPKLRAPALGLDPERPENVKARAASSDTQ